MAGLDRNGHRGFSPEVIKQPIEETQTMADNLSMALAELLRKAEAEPDVDTLREGVRVMTQALMELEVASIWVRSAYQRSPERQVNAMATAIGSGIPAWARSSYGYL